MVPAGLSARAEHVGEWVCLECEESGELDSASSGSAAALGAGAFASAAFRSLSSCRNSSHTGPKTAQTIEIVIAISTNASSARMTPKGPNALAFWFSVGPIQSGAVPTVPPSTKAPRRAPGRSLLVGTFLCSRKRGVQSQ